MTLVHEIKNLNEKMPFQEKKRVMIFQVPDKDLVTNCRFTLGEFLFHVCIMFFSVLASGYLVCMKEV